MIKEVKRETPPPKKRPNLFLRLLAFLVTLALVAGAIFLVVNRDKLNFDALKRWFTYRSLAQSDSGGGEAFPYQGGNSLTLVNCGGDLLSVSKTGARLYSPGGTAYIEDTFTMEQPVCQVSGRRAVVYDAGGSALRVYSNREQVFMWEEEDATILSARLNAGGYLAVVTRASGYKGVVHVYNDRCKPVLSLRISSAYVLDAVVSPDNRSLLTVTAAQENRLFASTLARYSLSELDPDAPTPTVTWSLENQLPLDLVWDSNGLRVVTEYSALAADGSLTQTGRLDWADRYLKRYSLLGGDAIITLTGKYRSGSQTTLEVIDRSGQVTASLDQSQPILSMSAAGKYIGVLTSQELSIYTQDLTLYATVENQGASHVVMLEDGSAYLATQDTARLCLPQ